ncbi:Bug family tripartite tricarboxylate transporter substrate binding protein [Alicycliphilus denitrificans]|uniref:Twin-arginine translocation pathway signal n=1 Tax=Alicycliphilus denitrificans (strain DSM 14773 / CIP 107495 / K601) TaxID=596154 RepID=F4GDP3_ALIDK|nr:tripartite tricarboxylate transporter substrate binding protein [Alicycliphilus denitrificans]ADU97984.1 twin-arginine translocation pathway signal [Alicycliphilus denitrificans BC]AEB82626.1 twin-arginine translocation pathway signal [Alicycliphilus denitrificans K601]GAO25920.1 extra-cytoplasmic solute receptor [Alicycliphilus sp. B1]
MRRADFAIITRRALCAGAVLGWALTAAPGACAQGAYPSRPIVMVVPQAAGGTNDIVGRVVAQKLAEKLGGSAVVENKPGAGGNIGTQAVARAPKDGYTLLMTISSSQAINPALYKAPGFDPVADFQPISLIGAVPNVLLAHPSFPAKTVPELLALAKSQPRTLQYASAGNGTLNHLLGEMLNQMAGIELQHVPYKGVAPALNDVLGGQLPLLFGSLPSTLAHIKAGRLRALAVSSPQRSPVLPDVPALAEFVPGYSGTLWIGLFAPAGVPNEALARLQDGMRQAMADKELRDKLEAQGVELAGTANKPVTPNEFAALLKQDIAKWAQIVKTSGATIN